jgi:putative hemolysin
MFSNKTSPFKLSGNLQYSKYTLVNQLIEKTTGLSHLNQLYQTLPISNTPEEFLNQVFDLFKISYQYQSDELLHLPKEGGAIVVANHPFGAIEGMMIASLLRKIRPDVKIMANYLLHEIPELRELFIAVNPFGHSKATSYNMRPLKEAVQWVKKGGLLVIFPAGEVSHWQWSQKQISDPVWSESVARLIRLAKAPVVPILFEGKNSFLFQMIGFIHPRLRTLLLAREMLNKTHQIIPIRIGSMISFEDLNSMDDKTLINYLRAKTYLLNKITISAPKKTIPLMKRFMHPIVKKQPIDLLEKEIDELPQNQLLVKNGEMQVYYASASQIPFLLQELGRLREITFREVGEGTGKASDIDLFDQFYLHLFIWDQANKSLVGAYRLGLSDKIIAHYGIKGFYTRTLFKYKRNFIDALNPAIELGRSFICLEYQKSYAPLLLLWKGIGQFIVQHPRYRVLFGPVSISSDYHQLSQQILVEFLKINHYSPELATQVKARALFREQLPTHWKTHLNHLTEIDEISELISKIENNRKGIPILLKQYLKLGGVLLGFNVDKYFNNALDGLIMVDLCQTEIKVLQRYMGKAEAEQFLNYHQVSQENIFAKAA